MRTRGSPSYPSGAVSPDRTSTDLYANAEALREERAMPQSEYTDSTGTGVMQPGRKWIYSDSLQARRDAIRKSDVPIAILISAIFLLGFVLGRTSRSA